jgi:TetR/AcrR family transcriptional repressor of nem operon
MEQEGLMARQKEFNQTRVVEQAMHLFWEKGYEGTSIEELAQCTGLGRGSLYNAFGDKHTLYMEALTRYQSIVRERFAILREEGVPFREALDRFFRVNIDDALSHPAHRGCFMVNASLDIAPADQEIKSKVQLAFHEVEEAFYRLLIKAQASGELDWRSDPHQLARYLLNAHLGIRVLARVSDDRSPLEEIVSTTLSLLQ